MQEKTHTNHQQRNVKMLCRWWCCTTHYGAHGPIQKRRALKQDTRAGTLKKEEKKITHALHNHFDAPLSRWCYLCFTCVDAIAERKSNPGFCRWRWMVLFIIIFIISPPYTAKETRLLRPTAQNHSLFFFLVLVKVCCVVVTEMYLHPCIHFHINTRSMYFFFLCCCCCYRVVCFACHQARGLRRQRPENHPQVVDAMPPLLRRAPTRGSRIGAPSFLE